MYIFKNALVSITRNKGRNILIGIIILVIACASAVTLAIHNSAESLISSYKNKYEVEATLSINRKDIMNDFNPEERQQSKENMQDAFQQANNISVSNIEKYADSQYVKSYYYTMSLGVNATNLDQVSSTNNDEFSDNTSESYGMKREKENFQTSGDFTLTGYSSIDSMSTFIEGQYKITEGEMFTDFSSDSCLINSELATINEIGVGDKITIVDSEDDSKTYELTITGIFEEKSSEDNRMDMFSNSANTILTNVNVVSKIKDANSELSVSIKPTFILTSSNVVEKFQGELEDKGLSEYLTVSTNLEQVEQSTSAISNISTFAITFLIITLVIGIVVLLFVNMINIRERKYEIGVLRTIGMKKSIVTLQFMCELLIVAFASLLIGAGIGACISVPVSNKLLANEIESSQNQTENIRNNFGGKEMKGDFAGNKFNGVTLVQEITSIDAVVDVKVLSELLGIGLFITLISGTSAMISIERFSPLTILKERS